MSEELKQQQDENQVEATTQDQATAQGSEINDELLEKAKELLKSEFKSQIDGLNRTVSEREKRIKELEREKMSHEEQEQDRIKELEQEKERAESELRKSLIAKHLFNAGLNPEVYANRVIGNTEEEISSDVELLRSQYDTDLKTRLEQEKNKLFAGKAPEAGAAPKDDLKTQYENLVKSGKTAEALAIKRQASREGINL